MEYTASYSSPVGDILMAADDIGLTGLWFEGQKYYPDLKNGKNMPDLPVFNEARRWLDTYFSGKSPDFTPPLHMVGTPFQTDVWNILLAIPYGKTTTYGDIAKQIAQKMGLSRMSAQAVGGAVGRNRISIIVPCHRVLGADGALTGYAGGIDKKRYLLNLEGIPVK